MQGDQRALEKQNRELADALRKKSKTEAQTRHLYNALKRQQLAGGIELAAEYDAENVVQAVHRRASNRPEHAVQSRAASISSGRGRSERPQPHTWSPSVGISRHAVQNARKSRLRSSLAVTELMPSRPSRHARYAVYTSPAPFRSSAGSSSTRGQPQCGCTISIRGARCQRMPRDQQHRVWRDECRDQGREAAAWAQSS